MVLAGSETDPMHSTWELIDRKSASRDKAFEDFERLKNDKNRRMN